MEDISRIRLAVLKELKQLKRFFDAMESGVKSRRPDRIKKAHVFLRIMVHHMDEGHLTPDFVELAQHILDYEHYREQRELSDKEQE